MGDRMIEWSKANPRRCPKCGGEDSTIIQIRDGLFDVIVRWRRCKNCNTQWSTKEVNSVILEGK